MFGYLVTQFWPWLLAAFVLGLLVGAATWSRAASGALLSGWFRWAIILFAICALAAGFRVVPGRYGLWLETGLWHFASYIAGCWLGAVLRGAMTGEQTIVPEDTAALAGALAPVAAVAAANSERVAYSAPTVNVPAQANAAEPVPASSTDAVAHHEPVSDDHKPELLTQAKDGVPDDLKLIWGVGPKLEEMLHEMGVFHFSQIAGWNEMNLRWVDQNLHAFKGRAVRDRWIDQCKRLETGWRPESDVGERPA